MAGFLFLAAFAVLIAGWNAMAGSVPLAGGRLSSDAAVDQVGASHGVRPGLEFAFAESLVRRHAAAVSYATANPGFTGQLSDATLAAGNYLPGGWTNLGSAVSNVGGNAVVTWLAAPPSSVTQGRLMAALAAGWATRTPNSVGRLNAAGTGFASVKAPTANLPVPAGAAAVANAPALRTQVR